VVRVHYLVCGVERLFEGVVDSMVEECIGVMFKPVQMDALPWPWPWPWRKLAQRRVNKDSI
jgi:hypothetical protein